MYKFTILRQNTVAGYKIPTGIAGLDEMLGGGFPRGRVILVIGGPGTGKTILTMQFLTDGISHYGENGLYVSLDETRTHLFREMSKFGWSLEQLEREGRITFIDASPIRHSPSEPRIGRMSVCRGDFSLAGLITSIQRKVAKTFAKRIVVDPISAFLFQYEDEAQRRTAVLQLADTLVGTGATCLLTTEAAALKSIVQADEYLTHGAILLRTVQVGKALVRTLQIVKMRETYHDTQPRPYKISEAGINVYPREYVF